MTTYFTADTHFGHARIIDLCDRPFPDVQSMQDLLVHNWNSTVDADDTVWVLGDFLLGPFADGMDAIRGQLNGTLHLIAGNHDRVWGGNDKVRPVNAWDQYLRVFDSVQDTAVVAIDGYGPVRLSHFPHSGDSHGEDRYVGMRPVDDGMPLLHGHVHDSFVHGVSAAGTPHVNVGVDVWSMRPVPAQAAAMALGHAAATLRPGTVA